MKKTDTKEDEYDPSTDYFWFKIPQWFYKTNEWKTNLKGDSTTIFDKTLERELLIKRMLNYKNIISRMQSSKEPFSYAV